MIFLLKNKREKLTKKNEIRNQTKILIKEL